MQNASSPYETVHIICVSSSRLVSSFWVFQWFIKAKIPAGTHAFL